MAHDILACATTSIKGYDLSQMGSHGAVGLSVSWLVSYNQLIEKKSVKREEKSVLKENCISVGLV